MKINVEYREMEWMIRVKGDHYHSIYDEKHREECRDCDQLWRDEIWEYDWREKDGDFDGYY